MANKLELKILLGMVDKITAPLKAMRETSSKAAKELQTAKDAVKALQKQSGQIDNFRKIKQEVISTSDELKDAQDKLKLLSQEMKATDAPSKKLTKEFEKAKKAAQDLKLKHQQLTESQHQQRVALKSVGINTKNLSSHQRKLKQDLVSANTHVDSQRQKLQQLAEQQKKLNAAKSQYQATTGMAGNIASKGTMVGAGGSAALYAGSKFLAPGLDFSAGMSKVQALTRLDENDPQLKALRDQARQLGASTSFSANDAAGAQGFLAMAGFDAKAIQAAMPGMLDLAKANGTDLAMTADIASNILSGFGLNASETARLGDILTATTTRANVNLEMLGETMKYMAPVARDLGVSVEESAAMAGLLGNIGIQGSQAGTVMRSVLNRMASQTGPAADMMKKLGLETADAAGNLRPIPAILNDAVKATAKMGNAERAGALKTIFGEEAGAGISELIKQQGDGAIVELTNVLKNAAGENARVAKTMSNNALGDIQGLQSAWQDVGIEMFEGNNGAIRGFIQQITAGVRAVGVWMKANPELTATLFKVAAAVAMVAAVGGTLAVVIAGLLGPFAMLRYATSVLGINFPMMGSAITKLGAPIKFIMMGIRSLSMALLTTPIGWIIMGITAIIAAGYLLVTNWEAVKAGLLSAWESIKIGFQATIDWFKSLPVFFLEIGGKLMDGLISGITSKFSTVMGMAKKVKGFFGGIFGDEEKPTSNTSVGKKAKAAALAMGIAAPVAAAPNADIPVTNKPVISQSIESHEVSDTLKKTKGVTSALNIHPRITSESDIDAFPTNKPVISQAQRNPFATPSALQAKAQKQQPTQQIDASINAPIQIQTQPGMDSKAIAAEVGKELDKRQRQQQAVMRSTLRDID